MASKIKAIIAGIAGWRRAAGMAVPIISTGAADRFTTLIPC